MDHVTFLEVIINVGFKLLIFCIDHLFLNIFSLEFLILSVGISTSEQIYNVSHFKFRTSINYISLFETLCPMVAYLVNTNVTLELLLSSVY